MLGEFSERDEAMLALRTWAQAVAVIQGTRVIARKDGHFIETAESHSAGMSVSLTALVEQQGERNYWGFPFGSART
jgi:hypothetical protein